MEVNSLIVLKADFNLNPIPYWIDASTTYDTDQYELRANGNVAFEATQDDNGDYHLELLIAECTSSQQLEHPILHSVDLGNLTSSGSGCEVIVDVTCNNVRVGGGIVRLASAEQTSRPL